jgi:hypothetical protein
MAAQLGATLGHDFSAVRVHHDEPADALARQLNARAVTGGSHMFFRAGEYAPQTTEGLRLLAHEAAHVVQQAAGTVVAASDGRGIAENADQQHEDAADATASAVVRSAHVPPATAAAASGPSSVAAVIQRWPWSDSEEKNPEEASSTGLWDSLKSAGSTALDYGNAAGKAVMGAESAAWSGAKSAYGSVTGAYDSVAPNFTQSNKDLGTGVDAAEAWLKKGNQKLVADAGDSAVLGPLAKASAWMSNTAIDATGGVVKGVGDLTAMAGNAIFHPIDAAGAMLEGGLGIAEHVPMVPGLNTTVKGMHGLWDLANGKKNAEYGSTLGELGENLLMGTHVDPDDPSKKSNADVDFAAGIGGGKKVWTEKPGEAATRTITNLLPMLLGDEAAAAGEKPPVGGPPPPEVVPGAAVDPFGTTVSAGPANPLATTGEIPQVSPSASPLATTGEVPQVNPSASPLATTGEMPRVGPTPEPANTPGGYPKGRVDGWRQAGPIDIPPEFANADGGFDPAKWREAGSPKFGPDRFNIDTWKQAGPVDIPPEFANPDGGFDVAKWRAAGSPSFGPERFK